MSDSIKTFNVSIGFIDEGGSVTAQEIVDIIKTKLNGEKGLKIATVHVSSFIQSIEGDANERILRIEKQEDRGKKTLVVVDEQQP